MMWIILLSGALHDLVYFFWTNFIKWTWVVINDIAFASQYTSELDL